MHHHSDNSIRLYRRTSLEPGHTAIILMGSLHVALELRDPRIIPLLQQVGAHPQ